MINRLRDSLQAKEGNRKWAIPLLVAVVYFAIARLGLFMATLNYAVSPVWPASGFAIFIVSVGGPRYLISIFVGALLTTISNQLAPLVVLGISLGNTFEAFVGAYLLNRMTSDDETDLNFLKDVTAYFVASGLGAAASAIVGTSTLILFGGVDHKVYDSVMWTWWIGDFIGALLILPVVRVLARTKSEFKWTTLVPVENRAHMVGVVAVLLFALSVVMFLPIGKHIVPLLFLPVLLGAMFVSPPFGTLLGFLIACASIGFTLSGHSPFHLGTENQNLIHVQLLVAAIMLSSSFVEGVC